MTKKLGGFKLKSIKVQTRNSKKIVDFKYFETTKQYFA